MTVRYRFIEQLVLQIYSCMPVIKYPIKPRDLIQYIPNCRYMSYEDFARLNGCSTDEVIKICSSESGCALYEIPKNRYLILCNNDSWLLGNTIGRQRWTCAHEIGHVLCGHFPMAASNLFSENPSARSVNPEFEREADFFASNLLAPFPLFPLLGIQSSKDVRWKFGLSQTASKNKFNSFKRWEQKNFTTPWEHDICRMYTQKGA